MKNDLTLRGWKRAVLGITLAIGGLAAIALASALVLILWGYVPILALVPFAAVAVLIAALVWIPD